MLLSHSRMTLAASIYVKPSTLKRCSYVHLQDDNLKSLVLGVVFQIPTFKELIVHSYIVTIKEKVFSVKRNIRLVLQATSQSLLLNHNNLGGATWLNLYRAGNVRAQDTSVQDDGARGNMGDHREPHVLGSFDHCIGEEHCQCSYNVLKSQPQHSGCW